jgi:hypothetical protein
MSFERDQDEREDEEIRKTFAEKGAQIEQLQARIAALEKSGEAILLAECFPPAGCRICGATA